MKGVILAGGLGTRLYPMTKVVNKHLLPVGDRPMILHPLEKMTKAGITDIMVISGGEHFSGIIGLLGSGRSYDCNITFKIQDAPSGIAHALALAKDFVGQSQVCVILGDNIFSQPLDELIQEGPGAQIVVKAVPDPQRFGVVEAFQNERVLRIIEKPQKPPTSYAVTGIYRYDSRVFEFINDLAPSARGEYEITDVNNRYAEIGELYSTMMTGEWTDAGTHASLRRANELALK